jgi:hypothetical protein
VYLDWHTIERQKKHIGDAGHRVRFALRGAFFLLNAVLLVSTAPVYLGLAVLHQATLFWLFFDMALNVARRKPLLYVGQTAKIDQFFSVHPQYIMLAVKIIAIKLILLFFYGVII